MPRKCLLKAEKRVRVTDETFSKWRLQRDSLGFQYDDEYAQYLLRVGESLQKMNMLDQKEGGSTTADVDLESSRTEDEPRDSNSPTEIETDDMSQSGDDANSDNDNHESPEVTRTSIKAFKRTLAPPREGKNNDNSYSARKLDLGWCTAEYDRQQVLSGITDQRRFVAHLLNSHNQWCSTCRTSAATLTASSMVQEKSDFAASNPELKIPTSWESKKWFEDLNAHSNMSITSFVLHLLLIYSHWHSIPLPGQGELVGENRTATDDTVTKEDASTSDSVQICSMFLEARKSRAKNAVNRDPVPVPEKSDSVPRDLTETVRCKVMDAQSLVVPKMTDLSSVKTQETDAFLAHHDASISTAGRNVPIERSKFTRPNYPGGYDLDVEIKSEQVGTIADLVPNVADGFTDFKYFDENRYLDPASISYPASSLAVHVANAGRPIPGVGVHQSSSKQMEMSTETKASICFESDEMSDNYEDSDEDWAVGSFGDDLSSGSDIDVADIVPGDTASSRGRKKTDRMDTTNPTLCSSGMSGGRTDIDQKESVRRKSSKNPQTPDFSVAHTEGTRDPEEGPLLGPGKNDIACTLCLKTFKTRYRHTVHMRLHDKTTKCPDCNFTIDPEMKSVNSCRVALATHRREHHIKPKSVEKCPLCDFTVSIDQQGMMKTHMKIMHPEIMSFDLPTPEKGCPIETVEDDPEKAGTEIKTTKTGTDVGARFACKICPKRFQTKRSYKAHVGSHIRSYHCQYCEFSLDPDKVNLNDCFIAMGNHRKETHPEHFQKYLCDLCGRGLATPASLHDHKVDVHKVRIAAAERKCRHCDVVCPSRSAMNTHQRRFHPMQLVCDHPGCGKVMSSRTGLNLHKSVVHTTVKKHPCTVEGCKSRFPTNMRLKAHIAQKHEKQRNFQCDFAECGKLFFSEYNLQVHKRVHLNDKPLKCPHCDYRAAQRNSMNWHMKKHA